MDERDAELAIPEDCVAWCRAQDYAVTVCDDLAVVDLDWWNHRLAKHAIGVRLCGRDLDGAPTWTGTAYLRRGDLDTDELPADGPTALCVLYRAAAWLSAHRDRARLRRFVDVRAASRPGHELDAITTALALCRQPHMIVESQPAPGPRWSGWPDTPGVGATLLSLYCWAAHHDTTPGAAVRPQLLDQQAVASLIHLGWLGYPSVAQFTWTRYTRYCALLHSWAAQAEVHAELIEMWLVARWRDRTAHQSSCAGEHLQ